MREAGAKKAEISDRHFVFEFEDGRIEITEADARPRTGEETVECGGVPVETLSTTQILRGKLERTLQREPPTRDMFDIATAGSTDEESLEQAVNMLTGDEMRTVTGRWTKNADRARQEAPEVLHGVPAMYESFKLDPAGEAIAAVDTARYRSAGIVQKGHRIAIETATAATRRKRWTTATTARADLEKSGLFDYFARNVHGRRRMEREIKLVETGAETEWTIGTTEGERR